MSSLLIILIITTLAFVLELSRLVFGRQNLIVDSLLNFALNVGCVSVALSISNGWLQQLISAMAAGLGVFLANVIHKWILGRRAVLPIRPFGVYHPRCRCMIVPSSLTKSFGEDTQ